MPTFSSIDEALNALRDDKEFEVLASTLLLATFPDIEPMGGTGDAGRDAVVREGLFGGERTRFQYSIEKRWPKKVRRELKRYAKIGESTKLVFVFSVPLKPSTVDVMKTEAARLGLSVQVLGRAWVRPRLEDRWDLAERFLNVTPRLPPRLVDPEEYARSLGERVPGFDAALVGRAQHAETIRSFYENPKLRALLILGPGGTGKTRIALDTIPHDRPAFALRAGVAAGREIAAELPIHREAVLMIDDAHGRPGLAELQSILESERWCGLKLVLTARPGYREFVKQALGLPAAAFADVTLGDLTRKDIDALLRNEPHSIDDSSVRLRLVKLAQGNPLIAHMAGCAARSTGINLDTHSAFLREYCRLGRFSHRDRLIVGFVAFVGSLDPTRDRDMIAAAFPGESMVEVLTSLRRLADEGLVHETRDAFSVKPDILQPVLIADVLLPEVGPGPIDLNVILGRMAYHQPSVLERLAAATLIARGRGADVLRDLVHASWPPAGSLSASRWREALDLVEAWGFALPRDVEDLLERLNEVLRQLSCDLEPNELSALTSSAAVAARTLASADVGAAVRALLDIFVAGPDFGSDPEKSPALKQFRELAKKAATFEWNTLGDRQERLVAAVSQWFASRARRDVEPKVWRAVALAGAQLVRLHFEYVEESPDSGSRFTLGHFPAAMTPHLRRGVADAAALVAEAVPHLDEAALWAVLDRLGRIEGIVRNGMLPYGGSATDEARAELRAAVDHIVSRFVSVWESVPLAVRQRLVWFGRGRPAVSERARRDTELRQFTVFFPARDHGGSHERWLRMVSARARRLAAKFPGTKGLQLMEEALTVGQLLGDGPGAYAFVDALAVTLSKNDVEDAVRYCVGAPRLRGYAAQLLGATLMRFAPDLDKTVVGLVDAPDADVIVPRVLDGVQPATESRLLTVLMKRERPPLLEIADHVERCSRLGPQRKYALLVSICERLPDNSLPRGLTIVGTTARASKVCATASLQRRITNQIIRLLSLSEIAHVGFIWFEPLFEMVASWGSDAIVEVVLARVKQLLASGLGSRRGQQRLGKEVLKVVGSLGAEQKSAVAHGLSGWLQTTVENPWGGEDAVYDLLRSTMSADEFMLLAIRWAKDASTRHLAISAIRGRCPSGEFDAVARALLGQALSREEESLLLSAADLHGGMWGPLSPMYRERAHFFEGWEGDSIPSIRRFGEKARRVFEERATREERQEFLAENR